MRGRTTFYWVVFTLALVSGLATFRGSVSAQESEKFKNLKVLPKDISREDLRRVMGQFTRALGMRCSGCHVSTPGQGIGPDDCAKDDKPEKRTARSRASPIASRRAARPRARSRLIASTRPNTPSPAMRSTRSPART